MNFSFQWCIYTKLTWQLCKRWYALSTKPKKWCVLLLLFWVLETQLLQRTGKKGIKKRKSLNKVNDNKTKLLTKNIKFVLKWFSTQKASKIIYLNISSGSNSYKKGACFNMGLSGRYEFPPSRSKLFPL